jgi:predicted ATPase
VLLGYPAAKILVMSGDGMVETSYEQSEIVELTRSFLEEREVFLRHLFEG